jgi:hypothetical protein
MPRGNKREGKAMDTCESLKIIREVMRGRLEITKETSDIGSRLTISADRVIAILAVALIVVVVAVIV